MNDGEKLRKAMMFVKNKLRKSKTRKLSNDVGRI